MSEIYWTTAGKRSFHVNINGGEYELFDFQPIPGERVVKTFSIPAGGNTLEIAFTSIQDNAKVNSLAVTYTDNPGSEPIIIEIPEIRYKDTTFTQTFRIPYVVMVKDTIRR